MITSLFELASGAIELGNDRWPNLRRTLEMILPCWIDKASFNGEKIQLFVLRGPKAAGFEGKGFPAILVLRAVRNRPQDNADPLMSGYEQAAEFQPNVHVDLLVGRLQQVLEDRSQMDQFWDLMEKQTKPEDGLGQGDGCFRAYKVVFDNYYFDANLELYLSHKYTPA